MMQSHVNLVAWLHIAYSAIIFVIAFLVLALLVGIGFALAPQELVAPRILTSVGVIVGVFLGLLAVPGIIGGAFRLQRRPWARVLVMVMGCLYLANFPLGTALGVYTLWVLLNREAEQAFGLS